MILPYKSACIISASYFIFVSLFLSALGIYPLILQAQDIPIGTWRTHASYRSVNTMAVADDQIYAGSATGFFVYDQSFNNTTILSKLDGFSDTQISRLAFNPTHQTLLITYQNGNIDLLKDNTIDNISTLANSAIATDKQINHLFFAGDLAYLSVNFGVVVLDIQRKEIRDTYRNLGAAGNTIPVFASTIANNRIFLATSQGVLTAPTSGVNLLDFNNWETIGLDAGLPAGQAVALASRNGNVYAGIVNEGVFVYQNESWQKVNLPILTEINSITASAGQILVCAPEKVYILDASNNYIEINNSFIQNPREAQYDNNGKLWMADAVNGLISDQAGAFQSFVPNGPFSSDTWQLFIYKQNIGTLTGGYTSAYAPLERGTGFSVFTASGWINYTSSALQPDLLIPDVRDLVSATYNAAEDQLYIGSFGEGLLIIKPDNTFELLNASNFPLQNTPAGDVKISGLATDATGNTWMTNYGVGFNQPSLYVKRQDNTWQSYAFTNQAARFPTGILIDDNDYKWLQLGIQFGGGIWVFDEKNNQSRYLTTTLGQGGLPNTHVRSMAKDKEGQIWVGTERGVVVFFNPADVFTANAFDAFTPFVDGRQLLRDELVSSIAVDGGNRKWIGTRNGVWLFSPEGNQLVHHFTTQNSPLLSNIILDVKIQDSTGEVFIATDRGIISYRGTATTGQEVHSNVKVFPNPVKPGFEGLVGISGLVNNAIVKITDVSGRLVYETRAQGSTAVWNVRDYTGRRAASGIYLIFSADADGQETLVTKMAVIE